MFSKKIFITLLGFITSICFIWGIWLFSSMQHVKLYNLPPITSPNDKVVVLVCIMDGNGGGERGTLAQHKEFIRIGIKSILVCKEKSFLANECHNEKLPLTTCSSFKFGSGPFVLMPGVQAALDTLVKIYQQHIQALHCSIRNEVFIAKKARSKLVIPIILTQHTPSHLSKAVRNTADGIVGLSKDIANYSSGLNKQDGITRTKIIAIPPFFDVSRIQAFTPTTQSKNDFFKEQFKVELKNCPLLIKVANLYSHVEHKNHPLLFQAMHELIYKRNIPIQAALAGSGPNLGRYQKMVHDLGLDSYVYFLGNTNQIPALMHYADINVLASSKEAFGIVLLEGGLLEKPTIVARSGCEAADWLILDQETGFLFENKNATDLANKIAYVLAHPEEAQACGRRLREKVIAEFLPEHTIHVMLNFYSQAKKTLLD